MKWKLINGSEKKVLDCENNFGCDGGSELISETVMHL